MRCGWPAVSPSIGTCAGTSREARAWFPPRCSPIRRCAPVLRASTLLRRSDSCRSARRTGNRACPGARKPRHWRDSTAMPWMSFRARAGAERRRPTVWRSAMQATANINQIASLAVGVGELPVGWGYAAIGSGYEHLRHHHSHAAVVAFENAIGIDALAVFRIPGARWNTSYGLGALALHRGRARYCSSGFSLSPDHRPQPRDCDSMGSCRGSLKVLAEYRRAC